MKLLLIHSDFIEYEVKDKAIKNPEETDKKTDRFEEALTAFTAVEKIDEKSPQQAVKDAVAEIEKTAQQVKAKNIMLYPYAHLSILYFVNFYWFCCGYPCSHFIRISSDRDIQGCIKNWRKK